MKFPGATADLIASKNLFDIYLKTKVLDVCGDALKENRWEWFITFNIKIKSVNIFYEENLYLIKDFYLMERKGLYGSMAGFIVSVSLQPLENIKTVLLVPPK